jgi:hypothetical protein
MTKEIGSLEKSESGYTLSQRHIPEEQNPPSGDTFRTLCTQRAWFCLYLFMYLPLSSVVSRDGGSLCLFLTAPLTIQTDRVGVTST